MRRKASNLQILAEIAVLATLVCWGGNVFLGESNESWDALFRMSLGAGLAITLLSALCLLRNLMTAYIGAVICTLIYLGNVAGII